MESISLEPRLLRLLCLVVEEYVARAEPVGSQALVERRHLEVSPATVRNWFTELEQHGLVTQPYTSGGRIPTEDGFRVYVNQCLQKRPLQAKERKWLERSAALPAKDGQRLKGAAKILSELAGLAVYVGWQWSDTYYTGLSQLFTQPEFKSWQQVVSLSEILDHLDDTLLILKRTQYSAPQVFIGRECPFGPACATIVISQEQAMIGILGPMRMDYERHLSLMNCLQEKFFT